MEIRMMVYCIGCRCVSSLHCALAIPAHCIPWDKDKAILQVSDHTSSVTFHH